jgi:hypothetical protein
VTAFHASENGVGAFAVGVVLGRIAKVELGQVAVHVGGAPVMVGADYATLQDGEEILCAVAVNFALGELARSVKQSVVAGKFLANEPAGR